MNILYVEDDPCDADLTRREFASSVPHFRLDTVATQREALARLEGEPPYDLVLTDLRLLDGDGLALLAQVRERALPLAVVVITGRGDEESAVAALKAGADDYVVKGGDYLARLPLALESAFHRVQLAREQAALRESEKHYHTLLDGVPAGLNRTTPAGQILDANLALVEMLGYPDRETLLATNVADTYADAEDRKQWLALMEDEGGVRGFETRMRKHDGAIIWVESNAHAARDADGRVLHYYEGSLEDITERKLAEEALREYSERLEEMVEERTQELRDAREQLVRREKLAVLGQLAGGVIQDLRNPLGAISNAAYFLNMVTEEPEPEVKEMLEILEKEVRTSERIISSLLDFAHPKPPIRRIVDVNEVVRETLSRAAVPDNVEVVSQLEEPLPTILADPDQLVQVFGNFILNAVQAMTLPSAAGTPDGGRLVVKTSAGARLSSAEDSVEPTGVSGRGDPAGRPQWVTVSFTDTGMGISEENMGKLFEPLFTTKAKGIGLGLPLAKTLVEGHGGSIEVESEVGKGSLFTMKLPAREA